MDFPLPHKINGPRMFVQVPAIGVRHGGTHHDERGGGARSLRRDGVGAPAGHRTRANASASAPSLPEAGTVTNNAAILNSNSRAVHASPAIAFRECVRRAAPERHERLDRRQRAPRRHPR